MQALYPWGGSLFPAPIFLFLKPNNIKQFLYPKVVVSQFPSQPISSKRTISSEYSVESASINPSTPRKIVCRPSPCWKSVCVLSQHLVMQRNSCDLYAPNGTLLSNTTWCPKLKIVKSLTRSREQCHFCGIFLGHFSVSLSDLIYKVKSR